MDPARTYQIYTLQEVSKITGLKTNQIWRAINTGKLKIAKLDGRPFVSDRSLVDYLQYRADARYKQRKVAIVSGRRRLPKPWRIIKGNAAAGRLVLIGSSQNSQ